MTEQKKILSSRPVKTEEFVDELNFFAFALLFGLGLLFELQMVFPIIASLQLRQALIVLLFIALFLRAGTWRRAETASLLVFLGLCVAVGAATALRFGPSLAVAGLTRFINVAVVAVFATQLITTTARLRLLIIMWFVVVLGGLGTALYQLGGGDMPWLVGDYYSGRADLLRYKTILGDPNVGGMSAAITLVGGLLLARPLWLKLVIVALSLLLIILSLSKAALVLAAIGLVMAAVIEGPQLARLRAARPRTAAMAVLVILGAGVGAAFVPVLSRYEAISIAALAGAQDPAGQSVGYAVADRAFFRVEQGLELLAEMPPSRLVDYVLGGSYGLAGSVAVSARGEPPAFLPHNGYLEIFLVGGIILLASFLAVVIQGAQNLLALRRSGLPEMRFLIIALAMLLIMLGGYPIMYEPILGSLFWLIIGASFNAARWHQRNDTSPSSPHPA
jgi:hypothetical protein